LGFLAARAIAGVETVDVAGHYFRTYRFGRYAGVLYVDLSESASAGRGSLRVDHQRAVDDTLERVRHLFDVNHCPASANRVLRRDHQLAPLVRAHPGLRVPGAWDPFEIVIRAMLGQQISVSAARILAGKLTSAFGRPLPKRYQRDGLTHSFPTAECLAGAEVSAIGMPRARGKAIADVSAAVAECPRLLAAEASLEDTVKKLVTLPGIGPWTAQYIAMRALHDRDAFPTGDIGLLRAATEDGIRPSAQVLDARAQSWRPWRAYACLHLWTSEM
jgi:3-methyladenine DNA glycosylase/8-oxoguanine DNA glycosylase